MSRRRTGWLLLPEPVRRFPADLAAAVCVAVLTNIVVFVLVFSTPVRAVIGGVFVLFVPGYAFIAALFPEATVASQEREAGDSDDDRWLSAVGSAGGGIDGIERVGLSFGVSVALVPIVGLVLNATPWGIRLGPMVVVLTLLTVGLSIVATYRRWALPEEDRFSVPYQTWLARVRAELFAPDTRQDALLNLFLIMTIVLLLGSTAFAVVMAPQSESFSAIYLLTENDDGELVADDYPTEFVQGESQSLIVGIDNHEHETAEYTVVALEQRLAPGDGEPEVVEQRELDRFEARLDHDESGHYDFELEPTLVGEEIRIVWLLFVDEEPPEQPSIEDTEYRAQLVVSVEE